MALAAAANDVDAFNAVDNCPRSTCPDPMGLATDGACKAVPPDEVDERPQWPSTGHEPSTAVAAVEPAVPDPEFPTTCRDCSAEKAEEGVVSAKRPVNTSPSDWAAKLAVPSRTRAPR